MGFWKEFFGGPKDSGSQPGSKSGGSGKPTSDGKNSKDGSDKGRGSWNESTGEVSDVHGTEHTDK